MCRLPNKFEFPAASNQNKGSPKKPISMKRGSKFIGHSTEIIRQNKIKGPLLKGINQVNILSQNLHKNQPKWLLKEGI